MDSDCDEMDAFLGHKADAAHAEQSGDEAVSFDGHPSLTGTSDVAISSRATPFERKAALINRLVTISGEGENPRSTRNHRYTLNKEAT